MPRTLTTEMLRRPLAIWVTVLVAVLFALAPTLTHALAFAGVAGAQRMDICTTQGPQTVAPDTAQATDSSAGQDAAPTHLSSQPHCPFCLHHADRCVPVPPLLPYLLMDQGGPQEIADGQAFFYFDKTSLWAPPRGPPPSIGM
jgi:hypothetical protein